MLEEALKSAPESLKIQNNLGVAYIMLGQSVGSKDLLGKAEKILMSAGNQDRKAQSNFISYQRMYKDPYSASEVNSPVDAPADDVHIEFKDSSNYKPGMTVASGDSLPVLEEISDRGNSELRVLKKLKGNIFILAMGGRIRLVLYKGPSHLNTDIKGGEQKNVYVSGRGRNGIVLSGNKPADYFEF